MHYGACNFCMIFSPFRRPQDCNTTWEFTLKSKLWFRFKCPLIIFKQKYLITWILFWWLNDVNFVIKLSLRKNVLFCLESWVYHFWEDGPNMIFKNQILAFLHHYQNAQLAIIHYKSFHCLRILDVNTWINLKSGHFVLLHSAP